MNAKLNEIRNSRGEIIKNQRDCLEERDKNIDK